jgi:hypothetical protein
MPLPLLAIDLAPAEVATPGDRAALVEACSEAFAAGDCVIGESEAGDGRVDWIARVRRNDADREFFIEVGTLRGIEPAIGRSLGFRADDPPIERWRTVGLVIGTLANEAVRRTTAPDSEPSSSPRVLQPARTTIVPAVTPSTSPSIWLDVTALVAPATPGHWRVGAGLRAGYMLRAPLFVSIGARYAERNDAERDLTLRWLTPSLGLGVRPWGFTPELMLEIRVEALAELVRATAEDSGSGRSDSASRWAPGARTGVDLSWMPASWLGVVVGGDLSYTGRPVELEVRNENVGTVSAWSFSMLAGVRGGLR